MGKKRPAKRPAKPPEMPPAPPPFSLAESLASPQGRLAAPVLLAMVCLLLSAWTFDAKLSLSGDNTEFITLARSLVQGEGLSYINELQAKPATKYPFGLPLLLAPLEWLFPGEWVPMKWLVSLCLVGAVAVIYLWVGHYLGPAAGVAAGLLCATMPLLQDYGHQVMSEVPYLAVSVLAIYWLERGLERPGLNKVLWAGFAALVAAYYLRSVGLVLAASLVASLVLRRDWRRALVLGGAFFLAWLPWTMRNRAVGGGGVYFKQLILFNPYRPELGYLDAAALVERLYVNLLSYVFVRFPEGFWLYMDPGLAVGASLVFCAVALYGAVVCLRRREHLLPLIYSALFLFTVVVWPWTGERFLIPLVPLAVFFAFCGALDLVGRLGGGRIAPVVLAVALLFVGASHARGLSVLADRGAGDYPPQWNNYYLAGRWLAANTAEDAVVVCRKSYWMYIVSGRTAQVYAFDEPQAVVRGLEEVGADYVVVDQLGFSSTYDFLIPAIQRFPERFELLWQRPGPETYIFRFVPGATTPD